MGISLAFNEFTTYYDAFWDFKNKSAFYFIKQIPR